MLQEIRTAAREIYVKKDSKDSEDAKVQLAWEIVKRGKVTVLLFRLDLGLFGFLGVVGFFFYSPYSGSSSA